MPSCPLEVYSIGVSREFAAIPENLIEAIREYRWLLDRGYPDQPSIKLVGDRRRLTREQRGILYRGVFSAVDSTRRTKRLVIPPAPGHDGVTGAPPELLVDGHNVLFTIHNYFMGRPVVLATDGLVRDIGGTRARLPHTDGFTRVARALCDAVARFTWTSVTILLDEPLPWSREHVTEIARVWAETTTATKNGGVPLTVRTEPSVDTAVARAETGLIATSDTAVVDRSSVGVFDLGGFVVLRVFGAVVTDVGAAL
ncbi:MAG: DUF434 domain-containing protein [Spirochaetaceae bacterium]|nr:MAG: DUF434 domain-containing protein [Spirochaetaceae bacterium]